MIMLGIQHFRSSKGFVKCRVLAIYLLMACLFLANGTHAQGGNNKETVETARIDTLIKQAKRLLNSDPPLALQKIEEAKTASEKIHYEKGLLKVLLFQADYNYGVNLDLTIQKAHEALNFYENSSITNPMFRGDAERILADAYDEKGKKDSAAYFYYLISSQIEADSGYSPEFQVDMMMKLTGFTVRLNYDTAYLRRTIDQYLARARKAAQQIPDSSPYKHSIDFLEGVYYSGLKQYEKAGQSFIQYLEKRGDGVHQLRRLSAYVNIAESYMKANKPTIALTYIEKAEEICRQPQLKESYRFYMSIINLVKGQVLYQLEDYKNAIELITEAMAVNRETGTQLQKDVVDAHDVLAKAYRAVGEKDKALEQKNIYLLLHDSLLQRDRMDMVSMLEVRYGLEEKNRQIAVQKLRNAESENKLRQKNFWLISSACLIIILLLLVVLYRRNSLHKQRLQNEKINNIQQRREIELLNAAISGEERERNRIAMELHDGIGGILSAAKMNLEMSRRGHSIRPEKDLEKGIDLVDKAGKELRKTAHNMMPEHLIQEGLVTAVSYFCDSLSGNENTRINFQVAGTPIKLKPAFELSVYRIIQELLHNVLKHANAKQALVQLSYHDNSLSVTVEDDGVGIAETQMSTRPGIGLASVKQRVQAIKGTLALQSVKDEGTSIYMEFEPEPLSL